MTILSVVRQVCSVVGVLRPQAVFAQINSNRTMQEMVDCANEMAQRISYDNRDWTTLRKTATFTGNGVLVPPVTGVLTGTTAFDLPADYKRMLLTANVWRSTSQQPMEFVADPDEWLQRRTYPSRYPAPYGEWTLMGGMMHIYPMMTALVPAAPPLPEVPAVTAQFAYLEKNPVALNSGGFGSEFMNDADTFRLDERLLKLGMISEWKMKKGSPYAEDLSTYNDALAMAQGHDGPAPILIGNMPVSAGMRVAYPWPSSWGPQP